MRLNPEYAQKMLDYYRREFGRECVCNFKELEQICDIAKSPLHELELMRARVGISSKAPFNA